MDQAIKYVFVAGLAASISWISGYHTGSLDAGAKVYHKAQVAAREYYYRQEQIDARTKKIIMAAEHQRGFDECQEQF